MAVGYRVGGPPFFCIVISTQYLATSGFEETPRLSGNSGPNCGTHSEMRLLVSGSYRAVTRLIDGNKLALEPGN